MPTALSVTMVLGFLLMLVSYVWSSWKLAERVFYFGAGMWVGSFLILSFAY